MSTRREILAGAALAGGVAWTAPALAPVAPPVASALGIRRHLDHTASAIGLTFDDGPHPQGTPAVLAELERAGARATFFCVGEQVERYPALVAEVLAAGHEIALHGHRHRNLLRVSPQAAADDLARGAAALAEAGGHASALHRPPYGIYSPSALALVRGHGLEPLLWSRWGRDWRKHIRPPTIAAKVADGAQPGDILLLHDADHYSAEDSWRRTVAALPIIFDTLAQRGLRAQAVSR